MRATRITTPGFMLFFRLPAALHPKYREWNFIWTFPTYDEAQALRDSYCWTNQVNVQYIIGRTEAPPTPPSSLPPSRPPIYQDILSLREQVGGTG